MAYRRDRYDDAPNGSRYERGDGDRGGSGPYRSDRGGGRPSRDSRPYDGPPPPRRSRFSDRRRSLSPVPRPPLSEQGSTAFTRRDGAFADRSRPILEGDIIADRKTKEKPVRTLFVRNFKYETPEHLVRAPFDRLGEIKNFFSRLSTRGLCFITFYDLRSAIMAKETLHGTDVFGRNIDVHYSLPKAEDMAGRCDADKNQARQRDTVPSADRVQGTLFVTVHGATQISDFKLSQIFGECGDIKDILPHENNQNQRFVEFFDSRACVAAFSKLNGQSHLGGVLELKYSWDPAQPDAARPVTEADRAHSRASRNVSGGRGGYAGSAPRDAGPSYASSSYGSAASDSYGSRQSVPQAPAASSASATTGSVSSRLNQATEVQNLLASLMQAAPAASQSLPAPPPMSAPAVGAYAAPLPYSAATSAPVYGMAPMTAPYGRPAEPVAPSYESYVPGGTTAGGPPPIPAGLLALYQSAPPAPAASAGALTYDPSDQIAQIIAMNKASSVPAPAASAAAPASTAASPIAALLAALGSQNKSSPPPPTPQPPMSYPSFGSNGSLRR